MDIKDMDEDDLAAERARIQEPKREVDRSVPIYERVQRRADEIEATVIAAAEKVDSARRRFAQEIERGQLLEREIMEAELKHQSTVAKFTEWLDSRREMGRWREILREAAKVLTGRQRYLAVFSGAACELAGSRQPRMEDYLL